ncbi:L-serine dehydratase [Paracoccus isoporae]|uniref:L-serine dehydratase n=1 Tax=Paracoccus isoporae TaxID=591205 RepID=A0A1G7F8S9_9RHOB|nr:L-serine ammonia-lyase [Paracoccus isoporae]SDE72353.1 L-serine dehydratase [Paracoccus isoporae]
MFLSVLDIFKIGVGPSSSHTMGPMVAAARFLDDLRGGVEKFPGAGDLAGLSASLHGSLAFTGKGHATDRAVILGLCGLRPETLDPDAAETIEAQVRRDRIVQPEGLGELRFDPESDLVFDYGPPLPGHPNGLILKAHDRDGKLYHRQTYYSVGGGFVLTEAEMEADAARKGDAPASRSDVPFAFDNAEEMLRMGRAAGKTIAEMKRSNETAIYGAALRERLDGIWSAMDGCIERGLVQEGILPGGLQVRRRAKALHRQLLDERGNNINQPHQVNDWISLYALAVNEENAAGGRVVTSPTNGAAGIVPAVGRYYVDHCVGASREKLHDYLLVAAAIGGLIKHNASISGAEVGCQGEVGSASAMAAAGLCAVLGGSNEQVENAAEIALEHHLGMTCDPAAGLVQVPCIERNAMGAIKAVSAASLALRGDGAHFMPLDNCITVMRETGQEMNDKYKETSRGGIAVNYPGC